LNPFHFISVYLNRQHHGTHQIRPTPRPPQLPNHRRTTRSLPLPQLLGLTRSLTQEEDVSLITLYTKCKFLGVIAIFQELGVLTVDKPQLLPSIANIVNQHSPQVPLTPTNFLGKLYPPQTSLIQRMCELEENPPTLAHQSKDADANTITKNFRFPVGLITERLSFGKTFCLPALICHKFAPVPYDSPAEACPHRAALFNSFTKAVIPTNIIVCGSKVAKEWRANIDKHVAPAITRLVIETAKDLTTCERLIHANSIPNIIVIKDGEITWKTTSDSTQLKKKALDHFLSIVYSQSDYSPDAKFLRIIYDDYDMLKFSAATILPRALFSWFVSGTEEYHPGKSPQFHYTLNDEEKTMTIVKAKVILDNISAVSCNRDYSAQEFNVPKINLFQTYNESEYIIKCILENTFNDSFLAHDDWKCGALFTGNVDNPPQSLQNKRPKILIATKDKDDQIALTNKLGNIAVRLTRANIDKFAREDALVGVCGNLYGINMGFLTHIIVDYTFADNEIVQIIGRGQRLSRQYNLQVYFRMRHPKYAVNDISDDGELDDCVGAYVDEPKEDNVPIQKNNE
jgi:hypothetical protein